MRLCNYLAAVAACLFCSALAHATDEGFVDIFNGKDMKGWVVEGAKSSKRATLMCRSGR